MATVAVPGQVLGDITSHNPGAGTHVYDNKIFASISGSVGMTPAVTKSAKPTVAISRDEPSLKSTLMSSRLPAVGSVVLGRVTRVQQRQLSAVILVSDPQPSSIVPYSTATDDDLQFQAILRKEDVRSYEKDKVSMNESFRVGDIIRAGVISLGDERNYYVSTAGNDFGVVIASSEAGHPMIPASWREMKDVVSGKGESRKVAKPA